MKVTAFGILSVLLFVLGCVFMLSFSTVMQQGSVVSGSVAMAMSGASERSQGQGSLRADMVGTNTVHADLADGTGAAGEGEGEGEVPLPLKSDGAATSKSGKKKIAYAITVTKDGNFVDGALVLGHAARKVHDASKGYHSKYAAELVAFVAPTVKAARPILQANGWRVLEKGLPVPLVEIQNQDYANKMKNSGCCGADEFLKLWAYTLTEYHRVVHLDMDSIVFDSMDALYELDKEMLFTGDYNMGPRSPAVPAQGGFLVVRPSMETFKEFQAIIRKGDHTGAGWEGSHIGNFWGGQTIQGIVPFYYHVKQPGRAQELNRCEYNCMVDNPYHPKTTKCLDKKPTCQDCRLQQPELVKSAHFTICQKPWTCTQHLNPKNKALCEAFHDKWFALRNELELESGVDTAYRKVGSRYKNSLGMCSGYGDKKYIPIPLDKLTGKVG